MVGDGNEHSLRLAVWNVRGLVSKRNYKLKDTEFLRIMQGFDMVLLCETWTNEQSEMSLDGFEHFALHRPRHQRARRDSGGVALYYRAELAKYVTLVKETEDCILWVKIDKKGIDSDKDMLVCLCYAVPSGSSKATNTAWVLDELLSDLVEFDVKYGDTVIPVIAGDFNARTGQANDQVLDEEDTVILPGRTSADANVVNDEGVSLLDFCKQAGFVMLNGRAGSDRGVGEYTCVTANGSSVVDYVLCLQRDYGLVSHFMVKQPSVYSDHCLVECEITVPYRVGIGRKQEAVKKYRWNNDHRDQFVEAVTNENVSDKFIDVFATVGPEPDKDCINVLVNSFTEVIQSCADPLFGRTVRVRNGITSTGRVDWMTPECGELKLEFMQCLNEWRNLKTDVARRALVTARSRYTLCARKCRLEHDKSRTRAILEARHENTREFWKLLRSNRPKCSSVASLTGDDFFEYFRKLGNPEDVTYIADDDVYEYVRLYDDGVLEDMYEELNNPITCDEVSKGVKQLKAGKSAGPDLLVNEFFMYALDALEPKLTVLFNIVFSSGHFPESWSKGFVVPLHKKGSKCEVDNYRGITLLSVLGKLFTKVLNNRLSYWADVYGILIEEQSGFRAGRGTVDNVFVLQNMIDSVLSRGEKMYCAFIDFRKAYDYLNRDCLWYKLLRCGVRGNILNIMRSMYSEVKSQVRYTGTTSAVFDSYLGVRQGESLSPFLFSIYVNDLRETLEEKGVDGVTVGDLKLCLLLYADDSILMSNSREDLQDSLDYVHDYCQRWRLYVNVAKTKVVVFRRGGRLSQHDVFFYGDVILEVVATFSYLGVTLSSSGKFSCTQQNLADRGLRALYALRKEVHSLVNPDLDTLVMLFDRLVTPVLLYACEVWGFHNAPAVERVHLKFCKWILSLKKSTCSDMVYGELGRHPLVVERKLRIIKYWLKIVCNETSLLVSQSYNTLYRDIVANDRGINWATSVRDLLCGLGFGEVWYQQGVGNKAAFINVCRQRLRDQSIQQWFGFVRNKSGCILYRELKGEFIFSKYLNVIKSKKHRVALTRFRTRNHSLPIVKMGQGHNRVPYNERLCAVCGVLGDEYHCVFECQETEHLRYVLPTYYKRRPSMAKFIQLLTTTRVSVIIKFARFVYMASV